MSRQIKPGTDLQLTKLRIAQDILSNTDFQSRNIRRLILRYVNARDKRKLVQFLKTSFTKNDNCVFSSDDEFLIESEDSRFIRHIRFFNQTSQRHFQPG